MCIPVERSLESQVKTILHMILATDKRKEIEEAILIKKCMAQINLDKSSYNNMKAKISNAQSVRTKASWNTFVYLHGYSTFSTREISKEILFDVQKKEYKTQKRRFSEKVLKEIQSSGINCGLWRTSNVSDKSYASLAGKQRLHGPDHAELNMSNKIESWVFAEYLDRDICVKRTNDEWALASLSKLKEWIFLRLFYVWRA